MKFEGPVPETETRQVSMSFAAFIVAAAVMLFGFAMAVGTMSRNPPADTAPTEAVSEEQASSETMPPALPAVTQPEPGADPNADVQEENVDQADAPSEPVAPVQLAVAVADESGNATAPTPAVDQADVRNPSFPARHATTPVPATAAAPVATAAARR